MPKRTFARFGLALVSVVYIILASGASLAWHDAPPGAQVDTLFAQWDKPDSPGCALAIVKDGRIVHSRGYGMADLEHDVRITPASVFYVGSLSKQFTAMTIALLAQQGTLAVDHDIRKYLPELPAYETPITIRHLVHHTSGLPEYLPLLARAGWRPDAPSGNWDVLDIVAREHQLNVRPGEQFSYSNTGYTLSALIAERAARVGFEELADARIFSPLGMKATHFHGDATRLVKQRAYAYEPSPGGGRRRTVNPADHDTRYFEQRAAAGICVRSRSQGLPRPACRRTRRRSRRLPRVSDACSRATSFGDLSLQSEHD